MPTTTPFPDDTTRPGPEAGSNGSELELLRWNTLAMRNWLVERRNAGHTPDEIAAELVDAGWDADTAARSALGSLRSVDRQSLAYAALTVGGGLGALASASSAHLMIAGNPDPIQLTWMLSIAVVAMPIAAAAFGITRRVESRSRFVMWSGSRRSWFGALALCTAVVGLGRLLHYLFGAIATLTGASDDPFTLAAASQVLVSLAVAIPLFVWSLLEWRRSMLTMAALQDEDR